MSAPSRKPQRKMPKKPAATPQQSSGSGKKPSRSAVAPIEKKGNVPVVGIILGVVALAILAAVAFGGNTGPGSEFGEPTLEGSDLPPFQSTAGDAAVGMQAPVIQGEDFSGNSVTIGEPGTPSAVVFLAHWCQHCQAEVPRVQAWLDSGGGVDGVEIVSVATSINSARPNYPPSAWLNREGWAPDILVDDTDNSALRSYGAGGFPYWVFLNSDGTVAARSSGELDIGTLEQFMQSLS